MTFDHSELPVSVEMYLAADVSDRLAIVDAVFATDAIVHDEGNTYTGLEDIRQWITRVASQFTFSSSVDDVTQGDHSVTARITYSGDFPGSPVQLHNYFTVEDDLIVDLEIRP